MQDEIREARAMLKNATAMEESNPKAALDLVRQAANQLLPLIGQKALAPDIDPERPPGTKG